MVFKIRSRRNTKTRARRSKRRTVGKSKSYRPKMAIGRSLSANKMDKAVVVETQELTVVPEGGNFIQHSLGQYARATQVAKNYRFFRCKKVELEFIPYANVFAPGTAFPELYFQVDRVQGLNNGVPLPLPTKPLMLARGVMPVRWTSIVKRGYNPSVLRNENFIQNVSGDVQSIAAVTSTPVFNKWYATQQYFTPPTQNAATFVQPTWGPNGLQYFGAVYYVDQPLAAPGDILGTIKMRVYWEFKAPNITSISS